MKTMSAMAILLFAAAGSANAETFTFQANSKTVNSISVATGDGATMVGAGFTEGQTQVVYASGGKAAQTFSCGGWSAAESSPFTDEGVCTFSEGANDKASIIFSCVTDTKSGAADCWGGLRGVAGRFTGKTGTISWRQTNNPDGTTGAAVGTGMWND